MRHATTPTDMPLVLGAVLGSSGFILILLTACFVKCRSRSRSRNQCTERRKLHTPEHSGSPQAFRSFNPTISQSTPDITKQYKSSSGSTAASTNGSQDYRDKSTFKTVIKQLTLPIVSQRHLSFNRQLSHPLDSSPVEFAIHRVKYKEQPGIEKIKPELYRQNAQDRKSSALERDESVQPSESGVQKCGRLSFSLCYHSGHDILSVDVIKAVNLPAKDFSGTSDPYVKLYLLPDRKNKYQTKVHRKTLNPIFNERFDFQVLYCELPVRTLQFSIYDFDRFSRHDLIGTVLLQDIAKSENLTWQQYFEMDILAVQQESVVLGELMLSLCYLPTAGRLTITIIKAKNLKAMDLRGTSDPYVKVSLMCHGRRVKKKKTSVKKNTLKPVYNEAIVFDVPQENIEEVSLIVKVVDYDRVSSNELMGCCAMGLHYLDTGRNHWLEMLENSRKPVAQWYNLQEHIPCSKDSSSKHHDDADADTNKKKSHEQKKTNTKAK